MDIRRFLGNAISISSIHQTYETIKYCLLFIFILVAAMLPIIDVLSNAFLRNDLTVFDHIQTHRAKECAHLRIMFCTEEASAVPLDVAVNISSRVNITSYFNGPRAWFFSKQTGMQQQRQNGPSSLPLEYVFGFDSEFALAMDDFIHRRSRPTLDRRSLIDVLKLKSEQENIRFDVMPILYELVRHYPDTENTAAATRAMVCIKLLNFVDWNRFQASPEQLHFTLPFETLIERIQPDIASLLSSTDVSTVIQYQTARFRFNQALLLRFTQLWSAHQHQGTDIVFNRLLTWCLCQFDFLPMHSLSLVWSGIMRKDHSPLFDALIHPTANLFQAVENMAWQMTHLHWLEEAASSSRHSAFILPYCVSCHDTWHQLLNLNPVQCMLIDSENAIINFIRVYEKEFRDAMYACLDHRYKKNCNPRDFEFCKQSKTTLSPQQLIELIQNEENALSHVIAREEQTEYS